MKKLFFPILLLWISINVNTQGFQAPKGYAIETSDDYKPYKNEEEKHA